MDARTLVIDIETIGEDFDSLDDTTKNVLTRWVERGSKSEAEYENALKDIKEGLGFSPLTGQIVAIGMRDVEREKSVVYYQAPGTDLGESEEDGVVYKRKTEAEMLADFWEGVAHYGIVVTFNGRSFDLPFLMVRSAVNRIRPSKDFMSNRYLSSQKPNARHVDLLEQLSFYGSVRRKGGLHLWCRAFGIESPKGGGVDGDDVSALFREGRFLDIARYNARDIVATCDLYRYWSDYLRF